MVSPAGDPHRLRTLRLIQQLRHCQMAAFHEFFATGSAFGRLGIWPVKTYSWLANLAIARGLGYYYNKSGRRLPRFADFESLDRRRLVDVYSSQGASDGCETAR